jgi:hypothetical protein
MAYLYPTNRELSEILPAKVARLTQDRVGLQIMPIRDVRAAIVQWIQKDNYFGLQQLRGLDGAPVHVKPVGLKEYSYTPGVYGEFETITETELTIRAGSTSMDVPIPVDDLVMDRQDRLSVRELDRIEYMIWTLLTTGTFSVPLPGGAIGFTATFAIQTQSALVAWATVATATPLKDFRATRLLGRGLGVSFGAGATAYMNSTTANLLLSNTNASDLGGRRYLGGQTVDTVEGINRILNGENSPQIVEYDEGYYDDTNTFQLFIPNNKVVVIGKRPQGQRIGEYVKTLNANNPGRAPGSYSYVVDRANAVNGEKRTPPNMEVHQGHNGGPVIYYPGSVVVLTVS